MTRIREEEEVQQMTALRPTATHRPQSSESTAAGLHLQAGSLNYSAGDKPATGCRLPTVRPLSDNHQSAELQQQ